MKKYLTTLEFLRSIAGKEFRFSYQEKNLDNVFKVKQDEGTQDFYLETKERFSPMWQFHACIKATRSGICMYRMFCGDISEKNIARKNFIMLETGTVPPVTHIIIASSKIALTK